MIDVYSLCPGGTGKKIKFCCRNRVDDFRKIYKFLDANQHTACLNFIDSLLKSDSECACLLAIRCVILKSFPERESELIGTANRFYELHPENPIAIAESAQAILLAGQKAISEKYDSLPSTQRSALAAQEREELRSVIRQTITRYEKAFSVPQPFQYEQVVLKLEGFIKMLIKAGFYESANAWTGLLPEINSGSAFQETFLKSLHQLKTSKTIQLCFRAGLKIQSAPEGTAWQEPFNSIVKNSVLKLHWSQAISEFQTLAEQFPELQRAPAYCFNLALLHEWLCDLSSAAKFWEKYLACDGVSFYDALEKQIRLSFFSECPLEDAMEICTIDFPLTDQDAVLEKLLSEPTFRRIGDLKEDETILAAFDVLDSPRIDSLEGLEVDDIPVVVGNAILLAKQGEKNACLEVINVLQGGAAFVTEAIQELIRPWQAGEAEQTVTQSISVTLDSILRKIVLPPDLSAEKIREVKNEHCRSILLNRWIHFPLGILKQHSMKTAAAKPAMRRLVETVIYSLRYLLEREKLSTDVLAELRQTLKLPPLPEITPSMVESLPVIFYGQLKPESLTPALLERIFLIARALNANSIPREILEAAVDDPAYSAPLRIEILKNLWSLDPLEMKSTEIVKKGRALCEENHLPDVFFDIMDVAYSINEGKFQTVFDRLKHIRQEHSDDAEAMHYVSQLSQFMYGIVQNMNPSDLSAFQQKDFLALSGMELPGMSGSWGAGAAPTSGPAPSTGAGPFSAGSPFLPAQGKK